MGIDRRFLRRSISRQEERLAKTRRGSQLDGAVLLCCFQYQNALAGSPLANGAKTGTNILQSGTLFDIFRQDVLNNKLPQVSWIVAPEAYTEYGNWPPNYGAWYVSQMLDALTANPEVWSKMVFFYMFDENDGF
jgi:phospholipase C